MTVWPRASSLATRRRLRVGDRGAGHSSSHQVGVGGVIGQDVQMITRRMWAVATMAFFLATELR